MVTWACAAPSRPLVWRLGLERPTRGPAASLEAHAVRVQLSFYIQSSKQAVRVPFQVQLSGRLAVMELPPPASSLLFSESRLPMLVKSPLLLLARVILHIYYEFYAKRANPTYLQIAQPNKSAETLSPNPLNPSTQSIHLAQAAATLGPIQDRAPPLLRPPPWIQPAVPQAASTLGLRRSFEEEKEAATPS